MCFMIDIHLFFFNLFDIIRDVLVSISMRSDLRK